MDVTNPPVFGSLYEIIGFTVLIGVSFVMLKAQLTSVAAALESLKADWAASRTADREWLEKAIEQIAAGQDRIMAADERIIEQLVRSNEKILEAFNASTERHGKEHSKISERLLRIALNKE